MKKLFLLIFSINIAFGVVTPLKVGTEILDSVKYQKIKYYKFEALGGQTIKTTIDHLSADGDLYLKVGSRPTLFSFDCKSNHAKKVKDSCTVKLESDSTVYVAVYGFKRLDYRLKAKLLTYGEMGSHEVGMTPYLGDSSSVIFHPTDWNRHPTPVVFLAPAFRSSHYKEYLSLLRYIASHGYSVIYVKDTTDMDEKDVEQRFKKYRAIVRKFSRNFNTKKIGMIGHSSGGGISFLLLKKMMNSKIDWGTEGRFLFLIEPWFSFGMNKSDMKKIVDTNVVVLQFGERGSSSDPRISLVEYKLLKGIKKSKKDYQIYTKENANHLYPMGKRPISKMQGILRPLDALMKYTFKADDSAHKMALEQGSDNPYINGYLKFKSIHHYGEGGCKGEHPKQKKLISKYTIDYCAIPKL